MPDRIKGRVSVVVTNYNKGAFLIECLDGIARQSYPDWELIVVDDASTDESARIAEEWIEREREGALAGRECVLLRLPRNVGYSGASTAGLYLARGEYVAAHDSDDLSDPERLAKQVAFLESHPAIELLGTNYAVIDENGRKGGKAGWIRYGEQIGKVYRSGGHCICHGTLLIRGSLFDRTGGYTRALPGAEDYEFIAKRLNPKADNAENLPEVLYYYRQYPGQRSRLYYGKNRGGRE
ncbi:glycosyltransferase [Cohnella sp. AR92]|uniref:glycosyltransferase family 2 protein n=1 Tax=Cohnella sp. AR92 TaxID=648716 RepID=UPI000F8D7BA9|nr:glycosyltransferase [Cohnella sp. AR92]RUS46785.1 glycosyltransferase [Cohnella sp. AR92]